MSILQEGSTIELHGKIVLPVAATQEEVSEWIRYHFGMINGLSGDNPLYDEDEMLAESINLSF
jgi:hypothetical protein